MKELAELFKIIVRPYTIMWFIPLIAVMTYEGRFNEIPLLILVAGGLVTGEYWVERAVKRLKEK